MIPTPWRDRKLVGTALCDFSSCVSLHTLCRGHQKIAHACTQQKIELGWRRCSAFSSSLGCRNVCRDRQKIAHASTHQKSRTPTLLHESSLGSTLLSILAFLYVRPTQSVDFGAFMLAGYPSGICETHQLKWARPKIWVNLPSKSQVGASMKPPHAASHAFPSVFAMWMQRSTRRLE